MEILLHLQRSLNITWYQSWTASVKIESREGMQIVDATNHVEASHKMMDSWTNFTNFQAYAISSC